MKACQFFRRLLTDDSGVTAIEYALLGGLIAVVIVGSVTAVGVEMNTMYEYISSKVQEAVSGG